MPPKARITREMILDAAFEITRESGIDSVNARTIASRLNCSTQPVLYCYKTMDELRAAVFRRADEYQSAYIMGEHGEHTMTEIGTAYVRFAAEEKHLFRLLFQSDHFAQQSFDDLINSDDIMPLLEAVSREDGISIESAKDEFAVRFMLVHGMASLLANNSMTYDESIYTRLLQKQYPSK